MSTMLPGLGLAAGFSTSFWKIHGWVERQAFLQAHHGEFAVHRGILRVRAAPSRKERSAGPCIAAIQRHRHGMHLPIHDTALDPQAQRIRDRRRLRRALNASLAFVLLLVAVFSAQGHFDVGALGGDAGHRSTACAAC